MIDKVVVHCAECNIKEAANHLMAERDVDVYEKPEFIERGRNGMQTC